MTKMRSAQLSRWSVLLIGSIVAASLLVQPAEAQLPFPFNLLPGGNGNGIPFPFNLLTGGRGNSRPFPLNLLPNGNNGFGNGFNNGFGGRPFGGGFGGGFGGRGRFYGGGGSSSREFFRRGKRSLGNSYLESRLIEAALEQIALQFKTSEPEMCFHRVMCEMGAKPEAFGQATETQRAFQENVDDIPEVGPALEDLYRKLKTAYTLGAKGKSKEECQREYSCFAGAEDIMALGLAGFRPS